MNKYQILRLCVCVCVCVFLSSYPASKAHAPYYTSIIICSLSRSTKIFSHHLINRVIFEKQQNISICLIQVQLDVLYSLFLSWQLSSTCFGCYLHPSSEIQLPHTALDCVWFRCFIPLEQVLVWNTLILKHGQLQTESKSVPNQYLLQWNDTPKPYVIYGCMRQFYSWWWVQIEPETCRANDERNKEYSVHLVGPELNIYYQDVRNHKHQEYK
jgi:hypothetical protein